MKEKDTTTTEKKLTALLNDELKYTDIHRQKALHY